MKHFIFRISLYTMFLFGALDMAKGISAPYMKHDFSLTYLQLGYVFSANSLGYLAGSLWSGFATDKLGIKPVMMIGGALTAVGLVPVILMHSYLWILAGFLVFGLGMGWLEIGVNAVVPLIARSSHSQAGYFNTLHGLYGTGAFVFPIVAVWFIHVSHSWRFMYIVLLVVLLLILVGVSVANYRTRVIRSQAQDGPDETFHMMLRSPLLYGLLVAITAYVMAEAGVAAWLPTYLVQVRHLSIGQSSFYLSGFYLTFTIGRLTGQYWVHRLGNYQSVVWSTLAAVLLIAMGQAGSAWLPAFILAGFGFAVIFPTIVSIASHEFSNHAGKALGFLYTGGGIGSMVVSSLIGMLSTTFGLQVGFSVIPFFLIVVLASILLVIRLHQPVRNDNISLGE